jgi:hypothetical protein
LQKKQRTAPPEEMAPNTAAETTGAEKIKIPLAVKCN